MTRSEGQALRAGTALENAGADVRQGLRTLRRNPIFAATAMIVLALGVGAAAAVYGVAHAVLLADLPYHEPDRLVRIYQKASETNLFGLSVVDVQAIAAQQRSFESFGVMRYGDAAIATTGSPELASVARTTAGTFKVLRLRPAAGRLFDARDEALDGGQITVLSHALAVRWFGDAASAVGKSMTVEGIGHTIVGVLPPGVKDLAGMEAVAWRVLRMEPPTRRGGFPARGVARLAPGATVESAATDLASISHRIFPLWKSSFRDSTTKLTAIPLRDSMVGPQSARNIGLLAAGVSLVLLVAIVNVALLVMVRVSSRGPELAVRSALGAGRWRLARLLAAEGLLLGALSAVAAVALAYVLLKLAPAMLPALPRITEAGVNWRVVSIAGLLALAAAAVATISPVFSALARSAASPIGAERRVGPDRRTNMARSLLIAAEFALALPLLVGAGLLLNSFMRLQRVNPGYDPDGAVVVGVGLPAVRYTEPGSAPRFWRVVEQRLRESPAIEAFGISKAVPPNEPGDMNSFDLIDRPVPTGGVEHVSPWNNVTNGYFETLRIPLLEGRLFTAADTSATVPEQTRSVIVVSRAWAKRYYPEGSAVGKQLIQGGCTTCLPTTVVGVVGDVKYQGLGRSTEVVYRPTTQFMNGYTNLVVRVRPGASHAAAFSAVREAIRSVDPLIPLPETTLRQRFDRSLAEPRRWTSILGAFSFAGAMLATVGIFGLMSYTVRQRRREIGVRLALGATTSDVVRQIMVGGMRWAVAGSAAGLVASVLSGRWLGSFLFGVTAADPLTLGIVLVLLLVVAAAACWLAARRAADIHPVEAIASS